MWSLASVLALALFGDGDRSVWTPALPSAPLTAGLRPRAVGTEEILYVNFDGGVLLAGCGNEAHYNCSTLADVFDGYIGPFTGNDNQRISILQATRKTLADFGVRVTVARPPADVDYTMVMYGDLGPQDFAGVAPYIDCEDVHANDTSFCAAFDTSNTGSTVILQEAAHTWGLEHVDAEFDVLNPFKSSGIRQSFTDECHRIVSNTDLQPTAGSCNQVHTRFCETGYQNSYQEMKYLFGDAVPDITAPELVITSPVEGESYVLPITVPLLGEITDDLDPQFYHIEISVITDDGELPLMERDDVNLDLLLENPPADDYELRVVIADEAGNRDEARVSFTILPEGSELPADDEDEIIEDGGEECGIAGRRGALPLLLVGLLTRRRRAGRATGRR
ncbi:MAG: hypothetical protein IAG13_28850 [Deltaproteobacteria bacterium]|nr:hypothetical protein [Nannocystaceae bacterium]